MNSNDNKSNRWVNPSVMRNAGAETIVESRSRGRRLRERTSSGIALGTFVIELPCPATLTALSLAGFDFVVLDMEHSSFGVSQLEGLILAGQAAGLVVVVRTPGQDTALIGKVLDMGANGIMAPHVDSAERAREIVEAARYSPHGKRGFSPLSCFDCFEEPLRQQQEATFVIVQIEGREALDSVEEISAVPGIDAVFVGPYDLSLSLGVAPESLEVIAATERIARSVPKHLVLGIYVDDPVDSTRWLERGFSLQCVSFDGRMLADAARSVVRATQNKSRS